MSLNPPLCTAPLCMPSAWVPPRARGAGALLGEALCCLLPARGACVLMWDAGLGPGVCVGC